MSEKEGEQENGERRAEGEVVVPPSGKAEEIQGEPVSSDSEAEGDIFRNYSFADLAKMDTNELKRHLSIESRLSVSDEELERMDAEVERQKSAAAVTGASVATRRGWAPMWRFLSTTKTSFRTRSLLAHMPIRISMLWSV